MRRRHRRHVRIAAAPAAAGVLLKGHSSKAGARRALCIELRSLAYSLLMLSRRRGGGGGGKAVEAAAA